VKLFIDEDLTPALASLSHGRGYEAMRLLEDVEPEALARIARATGRIPSRRSAVALAAPDLAFLSQTADLLEHDHRCVVALRYVHIFSHVAEVSAR